MTMTKTEYIEARTTLDYSVKSWIELLAISISTHDSIMSERKEVPKMAVAHIKTLLKINKNNA
jgi:hypothetical protein